MATKTLQTRIKNRFDTLANWSASGVELLPGEIALVSVTTQQVDQATGDVVNVPAVLMKVGEDGKAFGELPWVSALAADVYSWAKEEDPSTITIKYNKGTSSNASWQTSTLADVLKDLETAKANIAALKTDVLTTISVDPASATANGVVQGVTYNSSTGKFTVSYGTVATADIANSAVTTAKIADANVTTAKIAGSAVTDAKIASGVSSDKINVDSSTTLTNKLSTMDAAIAAADSKAGHSHPYLSDTTKYAGSSTQGGAATSAVKVNNQLSIQLNSGTATTFDGSAAKSINITPASIGAATSGTVSTLSTQVETNKTDIASIKEAIAGGVHFRGTVTAKPTTASVTVNGSTTITAAAGDVVLWSAEGIEYIYTGSAWEELGDVTRLGDLETKVNNLKTTATNAVASTHKFVSQVTQSAGQISVTYTQPTSNDVSHTEGSATTVKATLEAHAAAIANKSDKDHTHSAYVNQNAFSNIKVSKSGGGSSDVTVAADTSTDTVTLVGSNITITGDATNDKITFSVAKADADGETGIVTLEDSIVNQSTTAATSKAVYSVNAKAEEAKSGVSAIVANYVKITNDNLVTQDGDVIIFDCGGAS